MLDLDLYSDIDLDSPVNNYHPINQGRIAWWLPIPDLVGVGKFYDLCGLYHLTFSNMASGSGWFSGVGGPGWGAIVFDGTNDYAALTNVPPAFNSLTNFSFACWVNTTDGAGTLLSNINPAGFAGLEIALSQAGGGTPGAPSVWNGGAWASATVTIHDGKWHHLVMTKTAGSSAVLFYIDGVLKTTSTAIANPNTATGFVCMGARFGTAAAVTSLAGSIADMGMWNRVLSAQEVFDLYWLSQIGYPGVLSRTSDYFNLIAAAGGVGASNSYLMPLLGVGG